MIRNGHLANGYHNFQILSPRLDRLSTQCAANVTAGFLSYYYSRRFTFEFRNHSWYIPEEYHQPGQYADIYFDKDEAGYAAFNALRLQKLKKSKKHLSS